MWQMVPRLWTYQIELPARTVVHLTLGITIGAILVLKILIVRFFQHLEGTLIPFLGTLLMICTFLVIALSVPFALRESYLAGKALPNTEARAESLERVNRLLEQAGQDDAAFRERLASTNGLEAGRNVLHTQCTYCHDLRTVLAEPRTANSWWSTVKRMAGRSDLIDPITEQQQWQVTAYLIAISPDLQQSAKLKRKQDLEAAKSKQAVERVAESSANQTDAGSNESDGGETSEQSTDDQPKVSLDPLPKPKNYSETVAKFLFESKCSECHELDEVENYPFTDRDDVKDVLERMIGKGMEASDTEIEVLFYYLNQTFLE